jgi:hypothetical protein
MLLNFLYKLNAKVKKKDTELSDQNKSFPDENSSFRIMKSGKFSKYFNGFT